MLPGRFRAFKRSDTRHKAYVWDARFKPLGAPPPASQALSAVTQGKKGIRALCPLCRGVARLVQGCGACAVLAGAS
eukprot:COSAG02_NODE_1611_length_11677_cov_2.985662_5_plen_76_part_00